jgi:glycosyltransferase involved in cell wall biosynthesis
MKILFDVSSTYYTQFNTGIQRVVRNTADSFNKIRNRRELEIDFLARSDNSLDGWKYVPLESISSLQSHSVTKRLLLKLVINLNFYLSSISSSKISDLIFKVKSSFGIRKFVYWLHRSEQRSKSIDIQPKDLDGYTHFFLLDAFWNTPRITNLMRILSFKGTLIIVFIHDVFPVTNPEWFPKNSVDNFLKTFDELHDIADEYIVSSRYVKNELQKLGVDQEKIRIVPLASTSLPYVSPRIDNGLDAKISLIAIGTVEPRKGYDALLSLLEVTALDVHLDLVGKPGWKSAKTARRIRSLERLGKVKWHTNASDDELAAMISRANVGMAMSISEGFGLPVVEMLSCGLPVVARDIEIFREVATSGVFFFDGEDLESWEQSILNARDHGRFLSNEKNRSWEQFTRDLLRFNV